MLKIAITYNADVPRRPLVDEVERLDEAIAEAAVAESAHDVYTALVQHADCALFPVGDDIAGALVAIRDYAPDLVFNLCEGVLGRTRWEAHFVLALDLLGIPYCGCDAVTIALTQDKGLVKQLLRQLGVPKLLGSLDALELYANGAHYVTDWTSPTVMSSTPVKDWTHFVLRRAMQKATVIVADVHDLDEFGIEELAGKTIITSTVNDQRLAQFKDKGVHMVIDGAPYLFNHVLAPNLLDAMILAASGKPAQDLLEDDYLEIITDLGLEPRILYPNGFKRTNRFAFVIHPLSQEYFKSVKPIELLSQVSPPVFMNSLEKALAYAPPFVYSKVSGIKSPTGVEAEGWLISVGGTPKEIMAHSPEFTYRRLLDAAAMAKRLGAQIMGLGAFTAGVARHTVSADDLLGVVADLVEDHPTRTRAPRRQPPDDRLVGADDGDADVGTEPLDEHPHRRLGPATLGRVGVDDQVHGRAGQPGAGA